MTEAASADPADRITRAGRASANETERLHSLRHATAPVDDPSPHRAVSSSETSGTNPQLVPEAAPATTKVA